MKQPTKKHKCKCCPEYMWRIHVEDWFCNIDGHIVPDKQCRCIFGKEWFDKNILHREI